MPSLSKTLIFNNEEIVRLTRSVADIRWLMDDGYIINPKSSTTLVNAGSHISVQCCGGKQPPSHRFSVDIKQTFFLF